MSSRWSYGPDGLRERPAARWSDAELFLRWRDLQPLLLRSAGVVGIVATIMAVVSSDALRFGGEAPRGGRNDLSTGLAPGETPVVPIVAAASELNSEEAAEPSAPLPIAAPIPIKNVAVEEADPRVAAIEPPALSAGPVIADFRTDIAPEPAASAPTTIAAWEPQASQTTAVAPPAPPEVADFGTAAPDPAPADPTMLSALQPPASQSTVFEAPAPPTQPRVVDLRSEIARGPAVSAAAPLTTASVPHQAEGPTVAAMVAVQDAPPAEMSLTALGPSDLPAAETDADAFAWSEGAEACPRDWVAAEDLVGNSPDCTATDALIALVAVDQSALEEAVAEHAENLAATIPRIPLPRPDIVPVVKPVQKPVRVSRLSSSWPAEPPPNCPAGQRAKWHFVDRKAGTKAWYCK